MGTDSTGNILLVKLLLLIVILDLNTVLSQKLDGTQIKQGVLGFKHDLDAHIDKVLAYDQIEKMLLDFETKLVHAPIKGEEIFNEIFQNVSLRYNDVVLAVTRLKQKLEKDVGLLNNVDGSGSPMPGTGPPLAGGGPPLAGGRGPPLAGGGPPLAGGGPPTISLTKCCCGLGPGPFDGKVRDTVQNKECYGNEDALLKSLSKTDFVSTLKDNYNTLDGVTWQYFADSDGHYVQYPASKRACGTTSAPPSPGSCGTLNTPLTKEWYVEKLHMESKNLVILVDNSVKPVTTDVITQAMISIFNTLTQNDKVNIVVSPSSTSGQIEVPEGCKEGLFVASQSNLNKLKMFVNQLTKQTGEPNMMEGLQKVYSLLESEENENSASFKKRTNLVMVLLHAKSKPFPQGKTTLFEMIAQHQRILGNSTQHFIYTIGQPDNKTLDSLAKVADQNNLKLEKSSGFKAEAWPQIPNLVTTDPVGPEGALVTVEKEADFVSVVEKYFQKLPPQADNELSTIVPVMDKKYGLGLTVAVPVYNGSQPFGVAAADGSLATIFSEIVNFQAGVNSYMFLVDSNHGHVFLHPKLRDPAETVYEDTIFPRLDLLEPSLSEDDRNKIMSAGTKNIVRFNVQVKNIHPEIEGELVPSRVSSLSEATMYCKQISGTSLVVVLVKYKSDDEEPKLHRLDKINLQHGVYHRLDVLYESPGFLGKDSVCHLHNGHFLSFKQSVVKFAPSVFVRPETYKYSVETLDFATKLNKYITDGTDTDLLNPGLENIILHTLVATDGLDTLWTSNSKEVIERFYGSTNGVFRIYPGCPLVSTYDHRQSDWYKRSVAFPNTTMYHYGKLGIVNRNNVIIISRAVGTKRLLGVVGMTVTPRFLMSQLFDTMKECIGNNQECHVIDSTGKIFDTKNPDTDGHLTKLFPWVTNELIAKKKVQQEWCTSFSDGFHKMILTLTEDMTLTSGDPCKQFTLAKVKDTNLFVLVLGNREKLKCQDSSYKQCSNCQPAIVNPVYQLSIPRCTICKVNTTLTSCQCQCYCDTDLDSCHGQFNTQLNNFPTRSCFNPPSYRTEFTPSSPSPNTVIDRCPIPCVAIEDLDICDGLAHCKASLDDYPTCIWKDDDELKSVNVSRYFPTKSPPKPAAPSKSGGPKPLPTTSAGPMLPPHPLPSSKAPVSTSSTAALSPPQRPPTHLAGISSTVNISPPGFHSTTGTTHVAPVITGSVIHPVTGSRKTSPVTDLKTKATSPMQTVSTKITKKPLGESSPDGDNGLSGGAIAALVISILVLVAIFGFVAVKMYNKKFRRPGADESAKYRAGSSMFDSSVFLRNLDQVSINASAPNATNVPYQEMAN